MTGHSRSSRRGCAETRFFERCSVSRGNVQCNVCLHHTGAERLDVSSRRCCLRNVSTLSREITHRDIFLCMNREVQAPAFKWLFQPLREARVSKMSEFFTFNNSFSFVDPHCSKLTQKWVFSIQLLMCYILFCISLCNIVYTKYASSILNNFADIFHDLIEMHIMEYTDSKLRVSDSSIADLIELLDCTKWIFSDQRTTRNTCTPRSDQNQQTTTSDTQNGALRGKSILLRQTVEFQPVSNARDSMSSISRSFSPPRHLRRRLHQHQLSSLTAVNCIFVLHPQQPIIREHSLTDRKLLTRELVNQVVAVRSSGLITAT